MRLKSPWRSLELGLAASALTLGLLALIAGEPGSAPRNRIDVAAAARTIEDEHQTAALELARLIRDRAPGLRVIDLRANDEPDMYRIPGAARIALTDLASTSFGRDEIVVLYADGSAQAAEGAALLRARGIARASFLRGGVVAWVDQVMDARIASDATEAERAEFREVAALSRYFGGQPGVSDRPRSVLDGIALPGPRDSSDAEAAREAARRLLRRGC